MPKKHEKVTLRICGLGFYRLYVNGKDITKGLLSPYISQPDELVYVDEYDLAPLLVSGKNRLGILLGSGALNSIEQIYWGDQEMPWRSVPKVALLIEADGEIILESDESFKTHPSPLFYEDLRVGERYDAREEKANWHTTDPDDEGWKNAITVDAPKGEMRLSTNVAPIRVVAEMQPKAITKVKKGFLYDFGYNTAGIFRMTLKNTQAGQRIVVRLGEWKTKGRLNQKNILPKPNIPFQECHYICKGAERETFTPVFSYYGYRYIEVTGITKEQATTDTFTMLQAHTDLARAGDFRCSMPELNAIQSAVVNSDLSNFFHYPTDCPTREKCGWSGDAAVSCEQILLNLDCSQALKEWLVGARIEQGEDGLLPAVTPLLVRDCDWYHRIGAIWQSFLIVICYRVYQYCGDEEILRQNADAIARYLTFVAGSRDERGLLTEGLCDWVQPGRPADRADCPEEVGLSFVGKETARMAKEIFSLLEQEERRSFAEKLENELDTAIKRHLICDDVVYGECLTAQSLGIYYDAFAPESLAAAKAKLLKLCEKYDYEYAVGMVGTKVFPMAMSMCDADSILLKMMTDPDKPSYTSALNRIPTALPERFTRFDGNDRIGWYDSYTYYDLLKKDFHGFLQKAYAFLGSRVDRLVNGRPALSSLNHHFLGDVSRWFYIRILGINVNPEWRDPHRVDIRPTFLSELSFAEGWHRTPFGRISVSWQRAEDSVTLTVTAEGDLHGTIFLPNGVSAPLTIGEKVFKIQNK